MNTFMKTVYTGGIRANKKSTETNVKEYQIYPTGANLDQFGPACGIYLVAYNISSSSEEARRPTSESFSWH